MPTDTPAEFALAVIWDMDGTLVDTSELHFEAWQRLAGRRGLSMTKDDFEATFGRRNPEIIQQLFGHRFDRQQIAQLGDEKEELYRELAKQGVTLLPGARKLLDALHGAGMPQAVGSSAPRENVDLILQMTNAHYYFDAIVAMEDCQRGKPDPQVFQIAAQRLGHSPRRCVVVEDAVAGIQAAKVAEMKAIGVTFAGHNSAAKLAEAGADLVVEKLEQLDASRISGLFHK